MEHIPHAEILEWQEFFMLEPFGEFAEDLRHGQALATLANINRDVKKVRKPYKPEDFTLWVGRKNEEKLSADQITEKLIAQQFRGIKVIRADK